jgi:hypothetical protein
MTDPATRYGITRDNDETIGFVLLCVFCCAITREELTDWCYHVVGELETGAAPAYLFDLAEFDGALAGVFRTIGFAPGWECSNADEAAIYGIAATRGAQPFDWPVDREAALAALAQNAAIEARFRQVFPFVAW